IPVGGGVDNGLSGEIPSHTGAVFYHELLAEILRQPFCYDPGSEVGWAARRKSNKHMHGPRRIGLHACRQCYSLQRHSTRCEMQESTTRWLHAGSPRALYDTLLGANGPSQLL